MTTSLRRPRPAVLPVLIALAALLAVLAPAPGHAVLPPDARPAAAARTAPAAPAVRHVFVINIENKGFATTWGPDSPASYLSTTLRARGVLLDQYFGTAHNSQPNYVAQISGQGPNPQMQGDCQVFSDFTEVTTVAPGQAVGTGCVFPADVPSLPTQMSTAHLSWKGYMDDMATPCEHPDLDQQDHTQAATATDMYAARHDPFVYFHAIIDRPAYCARHVVPLTRMTRDLRRVRTTPRLSYITPDLCHDGHDAPCADGAPGGLVSADAFLHAWVPRILRSPAFRRDGLLVITADESDSPGSDSTSCCGPTATANSPMPGITGPGGGRIGALLISPYLAHGATSSTPYDHYSLLGSIETIFGLPKLGYAQDPGVATFGDDVWRATAG